MSPVRPRLAGCLEFRLSALRVVIPGREGYERDLLKHLGEDIPDQVWAARRWVCSFGMGRGSPRVLVLLSSVVPPSLTGRKQSIYHGLLSVTACEEGNEEGRIYVVSRAADTRSDNPNPRYFHISSFVHFTERLAAPFAVGAKCVVAFAAEE